MADPARKTQFRYDGRLIPMDWQLYCDIKNLKIDMEEVIKKRDDMYKFGHSGKGYNGAAIILIDKKLSEKR